MAMGSSSNLTAEELAEQRKKLEKEISNLKKILENNKSLRGSSLTSDKYLDRLERELRAAERKLQNLTKLSGDKTTVTPVQDATLQSAEVTDPNEPDKGTEITLDERGTGQVGFNVPAYTLHNGDKIKARNAFGFMIGNEVTDAKDAGSYTVQPQDAFLQRMYNEYSKNPAKAIEMKRALIEIGYLDSNEPLDGNVSQAFRDALVKLGSFVSEENYFITKTGEKRQLLTLDTGLKLLLSRGSGEGGAKTTTSVTVMNREAAKDILDNAYLNSIGRKATKKEIDEFYRKVQKEAKARPTSTTSTETSDVTKEGFSPLSAVQMAEGQAEKRPEFLAYQLSTNFYNALLGAASLPINIPGAPNTGPNE